MLTKTSRYRRSDEAAGARIFSRGVAKMSRQWKQQTRLIWSVAALAALCFLCFLPVHFFPGVGAGFAAGAGAAGMAVVS